MSAVQEPTSVIVYGPQGSGKSLLGEDLRAHFGLQQIVEAEEFIGLWPRHGALILTSDNPTEWPGTGGLTAIHIADAMHAMGRIAPIDIAARIAAVPVAEVQKLVRSRRITVKRYRFRDDAGGSSIRQCVAPIDVIDAVRVATSAASPPAAAAPAILRNAAQAIDDRAALRDCPGGERSMARCIAAFNALTGHTLSETEGWHFMSILKLARATAGGHHLDDHTDHAAYAALAGEAAEREAQPA